MAIELPEDVPDAVRDVWENFDGLHVPDLTEVPKESRKVFQQGARGRCMTCGGPLSKDTLVVVTIQGVNQIYCSHKCNQDINVMGWVAQAYDDLKEGVEFRGRAVH